MLFRKLEPLRKYAVLLPLFFGGLALTIIVATHFRDSELFQRHSEFSQQADEATEELSGEFASSLNQLQALGTYFESGITVKQEGFERISNRLLQGSKSLGALAWAPYVPANRRLAFEQIQRFSGFQDFSFRDRTSTGDTIPSPPRNRHFPVYFIEPFPEFQTIFGYDLASDRELLTAMDEARDNGTVTVVTKINPTFDAIAFRPVYKRDMRLNSMEARKKGLVGFVIGLFQIENTVARLFAQSLTTQRLSLSIFPNPEPPTGPLTALYASKPESLRDPGLTDQHSGLEKSFNQDFGNQRWYVVIRPAVDHNVYKISLDFWLVLLSGTLLVGFLVSLLGYGTYRDALTKRLIEERTRQLNEREHQYQLIFNATAEAIVTFERDGTITSLNDRTEHLFGYPRDELLGTSMSRLMPEQEWLTQQKHIAYIDTDAPTSFSQHRELTALKKDQSRFFMDLAVTRFQHHETSLFVAVMRDISERRVTFQRLQQSQVELKNYINELEASRQTMEHQAEEIVTIAEEQNFLRAKAEAADNSKSEFLATMSHEIRTPLTSILGVSDLILNALNDPAQRENVQIIKRAGEGLLRIVNDILDHSKLEAGKLQIEAIDFHLESTIKNTLEVLLHRADENDTFLDYEISKKLPSGINTDPQRIHQILVNLIGNAVKFTKNGRVSLKAVPDQKVGDRAGLKFTVTDTGIGISKEAQKRLFGKFEQEDASTTRTYGGSGLGLSICKMLVELMDGEIGVTSELGNGSTFWFTLPYREVSSNVHPDMFLNQKLVYSASRSLNILLAEDNQVNRMLISNMLVNVGHRVDTADDGEMAVQAIKKHRYDLVLMDVRMPKLGGPEATEIIRRQEGEATHLPIIAVTADATATHRDRFIDAGMDAVVAKPIELDKMLSTIDQVMGEEIHSSMVVAIEKTEPVEQTSAREVPPVDAEDSSTALDNLLKRMSDFS